MSLVDYTMKPVSLDLFPSQTTTSQTQTIVLIRTGTFISTTNTIYVSTKFSINTTIELDYHDIDQALNNALTNTLLDQWQTNCAPVNMLAQDEPQDVFQHNGPQVSLTADIEPRFVNTLVMRTGEPDYLLVTTNLDLTI